MEAPQKRSARCVAGPGSKEERKRWRDSGKGCSKCRWSGHCKTCGERRAEAAPREEECEEVEQDDHGETADEMGESSPSGSNHDVATP